MKMKRSILPYLIGLAVIPFWSCGHLSSTKVSHEAENRIVQQNDGTISLILDKAACYSDKTNPSNNTADWNIVISKPGRFKVWLTSATKDTSVLKYANSVRISLLDDQLEANPGCDKIVRNSSDVHYPYFRADSYMGSVYVSEPGEYNIQLISEKVIARAAESNNSSLPDDTKLMSVVLTPTTR
jgi:hypothetical protein